MLIQSRSVDLEISALDLRTVTRKIKNCYIYMYVQLHKEKKYNAMPILLLNNGWNYCNMLNNVIYDQYTRYWCNDIGGCYCIISSVRIHTCISYACTCAKMKMKYKIKKLYYMCSFSLFVWWNLLSKLHCQSQMIWTYLLSASVKKNDQ